MTSPTLHEAELRYGIPDVELSCPHGGTVNPATFVGHQLIVVFLPRDPSSSLRELKDYYGRGVAFSDRDSWLLIVSEQAPAPSALVEGCHGLAVDPDHVAWNTFNRLLERHARCDRQEGAVYLFSRGGSLQRVWSGHGHAEEVIRELDQPIAW